ncbi:DUF1861 family protein [Acetatifactor muris]|jgi:hypothetical protein|uniref:DUF1861 family protein n=1 Tax=Acetatifactor muris TaxID=879566 RepID=A0A2K4ZBY4_9FIRM|nr:DUF1861 family protein [Acetatifactor muris]MCI8799122.1 DUF1861 family protein [Lachnospiraceae bacterium]MCR2046463.1 DUF1861 family protein [Acetatifactor muris]SOY27968.1 hypothetical protein AMURIS_00673 [Acetatifactor muris]
MDIREMRENFDRQGPVYESHLLTFEGVDGYDVYNTSVPFRYEGKRYLFGRVERREEWANSTVRLFSEKGKDIWEIVPESMIYQLEDPFVVKLQGDFVLGGTRVDYSRGKLAGFCGVFYTGKDPFNLRYYTTGPKGMKDIRMVELEDGRIGVFSRPRGEHIRQVYGSESVVGFTVINDISELDEKVPERARVVEGLFEKNEWGGCNQCFGLEGGKTGVIGHRCYHEKRSGIDQQVYLNIAFVFDPETYQASDIKVIGTRKSYPAQPEKRADLADCVFSSGIRLREDGRADLYSGVADTAEGRIVIADPFEGKYRSPEQMK